jgi:hypothetical protein
MSHTTLRTQSSTTESHASTGRRLILLLVAVAVAAALATAAWARMSGSTHPSPAALTWTVVAVDRPSLLPGGSVYDSQVPAAARAADFQNSGGSVYDSQVPAAARPATRG